MQNYTGYGTEWKKYKSVENLSRKDIAKLIRKDLKAFWKDYKFSVVIDSFAGGGAINCEIKKAPSMCYTLEYKEAIKKNNFEGLLNREYEKYTKFWNDLVEKIKEIISQYNFNDSDSMIDYFSCNFYSNVSYDYNFIDIIK